VSTVVVIGAGLAGLSAACHLVGHGHEVVLVERHDAPGGRGLRRSQDGFRFDTGPTVMTMPDLVDDALRAAGTSIAATAADGSLGVHGVETALMNRQCVGAEDPSRRPLASARSLRVAVKSDGSASGVSGGDMLGSRSALPCGGNGDGVFEYVLQSADSVPLDH